VNDELGRRTLLGLTATGGLLAGVGGTLFHAYTGPVALTVTTLTDTESEVVVRLERGGETVAETTATVPARGDDAPVQIERDQFVGSGRRGTTDTLSVTLPNRDVAETRQQYTQTCTGFSDIDGDRVGDHVGVDLRGSRPPSESRSTRVPVAACSDGPRSSSDSLAWRQTQTVPPDHADHAGHLHHLELNSPDPADSVAFCHWFLGELGYESKDEFEGGYSWRLGATYVVLKRAESELPHERRAAGLDHVAFHAGSRDARRHTLFSRIFYFDCE
jgi:hypothetical protein